MTDNLKQVFAIHEARGFVTKYGCLPIEAALSWPNVDWNPKAWNNFVIWCNGLKLSPHSVDKEVQVEERSEKQGGTKEAPIWGKKIMWFATANGSMACLVRFGVILDVLATGVVYDGETYERLQDGSIDHEQTVNVKDMQLRPLFGYITVMRPSGLKLTYKLTGDQLDDPKRNTKKNVWLTNRHEMYLKSMRHIAFKELKMHIGSSTIVALNVENEDNQFGDPDDLEDQPVTNQTQTNANQPTTSAKPTTNQPTTNEPDDLPF
jgi:hypothetical protein